MIPSRLSQAELLLIVAVTATGLCVGADRALVGGLFSRQVDPVVRLERHLAMARLEALRHRQPVRLAVQEGTSRVILDDGRVLYEFVLSGPWPEWLPRTFSRTFDRDGRLPTPDVRFDQATGRP